MRGQRTDTSASGASQHLPDVIEVLAYDPAWPARYREARGTLLATLGARIAAVEHIGSTSMPGASAKPTIDILVGVDGLDVNAEVTDGMKALGYAYLGEYGIPERHFFRKGTPPTHHVHWVQIGGPFWDRQLLYRDYMREHPLELRSYEALKYGLAQRFRGARSSYTEAKSAFIHDALGRARKWRQYGRGDLIVVDLEATCWRDHTEPVRMETIEIGAVRLNDALEPTDTFERFVRPVEEPRLSDFCRELTSIRQEDVDTAEPFPAAFDAFLRWVGDTRATLASWSRYDWRQFRNDCARHGVSSPRLLERHLDLQTSFAEQAGVDPPTMTEALARLGIPLDGTHHRGIDDAKNVAKLARAMLG